MKDRKTNFDYDLVIGQKGEKLVDHIFKNATVEVKRDFWTGTTGNIAVEFESRGKPSGISKTKSDYYAFVLAEQFRDEVIIIIKTSRLKEIAREYYLKGCVKEMGDDKTSLSVLIPIKHLSNFAYNDRATDTDKEN
tara:strand:+ start:1250 stop:1657 length:408 start_codon:yes stop_codon:yes gene_type:complete